MSEAVLAAELALLETETFEIQDLTSGDELGSSSCTSTTSTACSCTSCCSCSTSSCCSTTSCSCSSTSSCT